MRRFFRILPGKAILASLAAVASFVLLPCAVAAAAATVTSDFNTFHDGSIDGQQGWRSGTVGGQFGNQPFDQEIVPVRNYYPGGVPGFGTKAWRFSNLRWSGAFGNQTFSPTLDQPVTEDGPNTEFIAQLSFITAKPAEQPGLFVSISPDNGAGARMSLVQLVDAAAGTQVIVWDTAADGTFLRHEVAVLPHGVPHTIKFWMKLHSGDNNDVVAIYIDGQDVGQRFTTWENYYRAPAPNGEGREPPEINSLLFRASEPGFSEQNGGYLFFAPATTSDAGPGPPEPDVGIDKTASARTVHPGGLVHYTITAHNRGRATARNFVACDRIPREETFVSADRRLRRIGSRRCLVIHGLAPGRSTTFHLVDRVHRDAPAGRISNETDQENVEDLTPPPLPPEADVPGKVGVPEPTPGGGASVDVVRPTRPSSPSAPAFTG